VQALAYGGSRNLFAIQKHAIAGIQIFHPPLAVLVRDFYVLAAHIFVLNRDVTLIGSTNAEGRREFALNGRHDIVNRDAELWGLGRSFHSGLKPGSPF
jgi:hypothetical protein